MKKFPPRRKIRKDDTGFRNVYATIWGNADYEYHNYISELEHEAILSSHQEALKIARDALDKISKFKRIDWLTDDDNATEEADIASKAQQKIDEILNKKENESG